MPTAESKGFTFPTPFDTQYHDPWEQQQSQDNNEPLNNDERQTFDERPYDEHPDSEAPQEYTDQSNYDQGDDGQQQPTEEAKPSRSTIRKRLIVCCDGTGQSASNGINAVPTNVTRLARAIDTSSQIPKYGEEAASEIAQIVLYQSGIGTEEGSKLGSGLSGAFGYGLDRHILEAYTFLALNHEEGDEIFLFGFSRGAFTARAIASLICNIGLLTKDQLDKLPTIYARYQDRVDSEEGRKALEEWVKKRVLDDNGKVEIVDANVKEEEKFTIHKEVIIFAMGLFDTVGSLGIPDGTASTLLKPLSWIGINNDEYQYHDKSFPIATDSKGFRAHINLVYQVLALDECRASFSPTLLYDHGTKSSVGHGTQFLQVWMPGVHTDVGGGYERTTNDISDISFAWMYDLLKSYLDFRPDVAKELLKTSLDPGRNSSSFWSKVTGPLPIDKGWACSPEHDEYHNAKFKFGGQRYRTPGQYYLEESFKNESVFRTSEWIHPSVRVRMHKTGWRPPALDGFTLVRDEKADSYSWTKECDVPGRGKVHLKLDEWKMSTREQSAEDKKLASVDMEAFLLDTDAREYIQDTKFHEKLSKVTGAKSGWIKWLKAF